MARLAGRGGPHVDAALILTIFVPRAAGRVLPIAENCRDRFYAADTRA
jgi:hypothetical protein